MEGCRLNRAEAGRSTSLRAGAGSEVTLNPFHVGAALPGNVWRGFFSFSSSGLLAVSSHFFHFPCESAPANTSGWDQFDRKTWVMQFLPLHIIDFGERSSREQIYYNIVPPPKLLRRCFIFRNNFSAKGEKKISANQPIHAEGRQV